MTKAAGGSGKHLNSSSSSKGYDGTYQAMQSSTADSTFRSYQRDCDKFVTQWNNNPENRSKIGQLQESMEEAKGVLLDNLDSTLKRG